MILRNSWLPGGERLAGLEVYAVTIISFFILLIQLDFAKIIKARMVLKRDYLFLVILAMFFFISLLINSGNEFSSIYRLVRFYVFFFYIYLYAYYIPKLIAKDRSHFDHIVNFFMIAGIIISAIGLLMYFIGFVPISTYASQTRYLSLIVHPNYVSYFITITSVTTLYYYFENEKKLSLLKKIGIISALLVELASQILTLSRGGLLGTTFGVFLLLLLRYKKKIIYIVPFFLVLVAYFASEIFRSKGIGSTFARYLLMIPVYYMFIENSIHTIFGFGVTNSFEAYARYRGVYGIAEAVNNPHNTLLSIFIMFGFVITVLIFFFFLFLIAKSSVLSFYAKDYRNRMFYAFLASNITATVIHGLFDSSLIMPEYFVMQYFLINLGLVFYFTKKKNKYTFLN